MTGLQRAAPTGASWTARLRAAAQDFEWRQVSEVVDAYVTHLRSTPGDPSLPEAKELLRLLRENRRYDDLLELADALLADNLRDPAVKRAVALGLVDRRRPATALLVFESIVADPSTSKAELAEAYGGVGRCCKELYLSTTEQVSRAAYLAQAHSAYRNAYDREPGNLWLGINAVALLARAAEDGVPLTGPSGERISPDAARSGARRLAMDIIDTVKDEPEPDRWQMAAACEASLAVGDHERAVSWAGQIIDTGAVTAFELAALLRQLTEVWQLKATAPPGDRILPLLRRELLDRNGGDVVLDAQDLRGERLDAGSEESLEKVFGDTRFVGLPWYRSGLERCRAVARIESANADGIGTGFLVAGPALHPDLPPLVLVTNGHVIPEELDWTEAFVAFHGLDADAAGRAGAPAGAPAADAPAAGAQAATTRFRVRHMLWHDPSAAPGLDTTILELDAYPGGVVPVPVAGDLPRLGGRTAQRAFIIGHPRGLETPQYSLQDNAILDHDDTLLHYRSPTEPGSSGSPVFDNQWRLIGLHHAGRNDTPRLHNQGGTYPANEAILVGAIRRGLQARPPEPGNPTTQ